MFVSIVIGFFHWLMAFSGGYSGVYLADIINKIDHWIALIILVFLGGKMIYNSFFKKKFKFVFSFKVLLVTAIATSVDAFGVGLSYGFLEKPIFLTSAVVGVVAFLFSYLGIFIGVVFKDMLKNKTQLIGGLILIGIGIKIFIDHVLVK